MRIAAAAGATLQVLLDQPTGPVLAQVVVPKGQQWRELRIPVAAGRAGTHTLYIASQTNAPSELDWVRFE